MAEATVDPVVFLASGQSAITMLAQAEEWLKRYADSFEQRGGAVTFGDDCLRIVTISNDLQAWLTPERLAIIADLRTDV